MVGKWVFNLKQFQFVTMARENVIFKAEKIYEGIWDAWCRFFASAEFLRLTYKKSLLIRALSTDPYWKEIGVSNFLSIIFQMDSAGSVNKQLKIMQLFVYIPN